MRDDLITREEASSEEEERDRGLEEEEKKREREKRRREEGRRRGGAGIYMCGKGAKHKRDEARRAITNPGICFVVLRGLAPIWKGLAGSSLAWEPLSPISRPLDALTALF